MPVEQMKESQRMELVEMWFAEIFFAVTPLLSRPFSVIFITGKFTGGAGIAVWACAYSGQRIVS